MATVECPSCRTENPSEALYCSACGAATHHSDGDELIGMTVGGRYHLVEKIGQGSAGTLYRAEHVTLRRRMAVKLLHKQLALSEEAIERFRREAITVCEIDNDHIPQVHDFGRTDDDRLFFAMEFLDGETLSSVLSREGRISPERTADILGQIADGLMEAHTLGYVHRDLRPRSIFLTRRRGRQDFVKILDFGLAKLVQPEVDAQRTAMGMTYGDPRYMAPEQARGEAADRRADIYSLGVLGFEMLVGEPPFKGGGTFEVLQKVLDAPVPRVRERRPDSPPWLESVVRTALAKRPGERFQTVAQLLDALGRKQVLANQPPMPMQLTNQQASKLAGAKEAAAAPARANPFMQVFVSSPSLKPIPVEDGEAPPHPTQVMPTVAPGNRALAQGAGDKKAPAAAPAPAAPLRTTLSYPAVKSTRPGSAPGPSEGKAGPAAEPAAIASQAKSSVSGELQLLGARLPAVESKSVPPARAPAAEPARPATPGKEPAAKPSLLVAATSPPRNDPTPRTARALLEQEASAWEEAALPALHATDLTESASMSEPAGHAPSADTPVEEMKFGPGAASAGSPPTATGGAAPRPISAPAIAAMRSLFPGPGGPKASEPNKALPTAAAAPAPAPAARTAAGGAAKALATTAAGLGPSTPSTAGRLGDKPLVTTASGLGPSTLGTASKTSDRVAATKPPSSISRPSESRSEPARPAPAPRSDPDPGRETIPFERLAAPPAAVEPPRPAPGKAAAAPPAAAPVITEPSPVIAGLGPAEGEEDADTGDATIPQIRVAAREDETPLIGHLASSRSPTPGGTSAAAPEAAAADTAAAASQESPSRDTPKDGAAAPRSPGAEANWFSTPAASATEGFAADEGDIPLARPPLPKWLVPAAAAGLLLLLLVYIATRPATPRPSPTVTAVTSPALPAPTPEPSSAANTQPAAPPQPATPPAATPEPGAAKPGPEVTPLPVATALPATSPAGDRTAPAKGPEAAAAGPGDRTATEQPTASPIAAAPAAEQPAREAPRPAAEPAGPPAKAKAGSAKERRAAAAEDKASEGKTKVAPGTKKADADRKEAATQPPDKSAPESAPAKADKPDKKPGDAAALLQSGRKKLDDGEPEAAAALFARAVELDPRSAEAVGGLGEAAFEQGNFEVAARQLGKAAKLAPRRTSYQELLVQALYKIGKFKECADASRKLLKQAPGSAKAKQTLELAEKKLNP